MINKSIWDSPTLSSPLLGKRELLLKHSNRSQKPYCILEGSPQLLFFQSQLLVQMNHKSPRKSTTGLGEASHLYKVRLFFASLRDSSWRVEKRRAIIGACKNIRAKNLMKWRPVQAEVPALARKGLVKC